MPVNAPPSSVSPAAQMFKSEKCSNVQIQKKFQNFSKIVLVVVVVVVVVVLVVVVIVVVESSCSSSVGGVFGVMIQ